MGELDIEAETLNRQLKLRGDVQTRDGNLGSEDESRPRRDHLMRWASQTQYRGFWGVYLGNRVRFMSYAQPGYRDTHPRDDEWKWRLGLLRLIKKA